ncbi:MAG: thioredoxin family protein [Elusimicrobiota bacterium]
MGLNIDEIAPDFDLPGVDGRHYSLKNLPAKAVAVIFSCNHCPYVHAYEDRMIEIQKQFGGPDFQILAVNSNDDKNYPEDSLAKMIERAKNQGFNFPYLRDETQEVARAYGAAKTPHVFLLDQDRQTRYIGAIDDNWEHPSKVRRRYLEQAIKAVLAGQKPPTSETFPIGCSIKWRR